MKVDQLREEVAIELEALEATVKELLALQADEERHLEEEFQDYGLRYPAERVRQGHDGSCVVCRAMQFSRDARIRSRLVQTIW